MPKEKKSKTLCVESLRHSEYYGMQEVFDNLYAKSRDGTRFNDLMSIILSRENILLAYRNIKTNRGSNTPGTDKLTIEDIGGLTPDAMVSKTRAIVQGSKDWGYRPRPVRRKEIPKPNGSMRPLGIPCIWDRLIQQCIKQVLEPICEAKFSDNSYGFRPNRSVEHAIAAVYKLLQRSNLHYVIEFDIKGFFDNVNHAKLIRQMWAMGIHDKTLLWTIKRILEAPIRMPDGKMEYPNKGTPQGGILSPLLANVVLNELDRWVESQWQTNPLTKKYSTAINNNGSENHSNGYRAMKKTHLKEMYIVRYADDFRIFCRTKADANNVLIAVTKWLWDRLKLEVSPEKTRVVNVKRNNAEFLGFSMKVKSKGPKYAVTSHMTNKAVKSEKEKLSEQIKRIANPSQGRTELDEIRLYNSMVMGIHNYYCIATNINRDCAILKRSAMTMLTNRLGTQKGCRLKKKGRELSDQERKMYGQSEMLRFVAGTNEPIYPIGYVQHKNPKMLRREICCYTRDGRKQLHDDLRINKALMIALMRQPLYGRSAEYADNRISLFSAQWGRCSVTGIEFTCISDIHCHHKIPKSHDGSDRYENLTLVLEPVHRLIHATADNTVEFYLKCLNLNSQQIAKLNKLRVQAGNNEISAVG